MRLLFVIPAYAPFIGGAQTFARAMIRRLVADGHQVTVLTTDARRADDFWRPPQIARLPGREEVDGATVVRLPIQYPGPAPYRFGLLRRAGHWLGRSGLPSTLQAPVLSHLARFMPPLIDLQSTMERLVTGVDLVQAIDANWDGLFTMASQTAQKTGTPFVAVPLIHTGSAQIRVHFTMPHQLLAYRQASAVIALSRAERDLLANCGMAQGRLHVLAMGVEAHSAGVHPQLSAAFCSWYNLKQPFVAFLGAATYDKGAFTLARAILELQRRGSDCWLACAGPQQAQLQHFMDAQPAGERRLLQERVRLLGIVDEPAKGALLSASAVLALPSRVDSFGIVLLEAWLHGKPVVAAAEGGLAETVAAGETGLLVPFGDVTALATALERLLQDPGLAQRLGETGHDRVVSRYTWNHTYEALLDIYGRIEQWGHVDRVLGWGNDSAERAWRGRGRRGGTGIAGLSALDATGGGYEPLGRDQ